MTDTTPPGPRGHFLSVQLLVWGTYAAVRYAASLPAITPDERLIMALASAVRGATGLAISAAGWPLVRRWARPERRDAWALAALTATAAGVAWMVVDRAVLVTIAAVIRSDIPWHRFPRGVDVEYLVAMLAWTVGAVGLLLWDHGRRLQEALLRQRMDAQDARFRALVAQLSPHFLFNALNTVRALAAEDPARTREILTRLSTFLRRVLSVDPGVPTTVDAELAFVRDYLTIEQARFESGLATAIEAAPGALDALVPPLLLQPLVENAIRHGAPAADGVRRVRVCAQADDETLTLEVESTGALTASARAGGLGLRLTRSRLEQMYGSRQRMELGMRDGRVVASIAIRRPERSAHPGDAGGMGDQGDHRR